MYREHLHLRRSTSVELKDHAAAAAAAVAAAARINYLLKRH